MTKEWLKLKQLTEWIAQHKSLSIVEKRIYCHPCNYFICARQKSYVEHIIRRLFILNKINIFGAVASVGQWGPPSPNKVLARLVGLSRYIESSKIRNFPIKIHNFMSSRILKLILFY